jgi:hypothetical protein
MSAAGQATDVSAPAVSWRERGRTVAFVGSLWIVSAVALTELATRVRDWVHADEIVYERLAISIARTHSLAPQIGRAAIHNYAQLYPLLIAPIFAHGLVPADLRSAESLNAWLMSSACIPAFLLARRVTGRSWAAYLVAVLAVCMPWILYTSMLLTEVVAYPAFLWTMLAFQRATAAPSRRNDLLAVLALALTYVARAELVVLVAVLPLAIVAHELGRGPGGLRRSVASHRALAAVYAAGALAAVALAALGRLSAVFALHGDYAASASLFPRGLPGSLVEHLATFSLVFGVLPFVAGVAWLLGRSIRRPTEREAHAFACVGVLAVAVVVLEAAHYDVSQVGYVLDRYYFYAVPLVVLAAVCAALDAVAPRWPLLVSAGLVACGFAFGALARTTWGDFGTVLPDSVAGSLYRPLVHAFGGLGGARAALVAFTVAGAAALVLGGRSRAAGRAGVLVVVLAAVALPLTSGYVVARLLGADDLSQRPITTTPAGDLTWVDEKVGSGASVSVVPYPLSSDWYITQREWRDYEFWNRSVERNLGQAGIFQFAGIHFPITPLAFDPQTGAASISPGVYVLEADAESRFRVAGNAIANVDGVELIAATMPWRTEWLSSGLYDDGWTRPGTAARVRVFALPGQHGSVGRTITFGLRPPDGVSSRSFALSSNLGTARGTAAGGSTTLQSIAVCVPSGGSADVSLTVAGSSAIPGDQAGPGTLDVARSGGLEVTQIGLADELGGPCSP